MIELLGEDLFKAQTRIFDHRSFVNGEINEFLNQFELERNDIEVETLFKVTECVGNLKYNLSEKFVSLEDNHLPQINKELKDLLISVEGFLEDSSKVPKLSDNTLQSRKERNERRQNFIKNLDHKYKRVENSFEEKEEEIAELYAGLQLKLNIATQK